jgi:cytochrome P450
MGHAGPFFADKLAFFTRCAREHGDIVPLRIGPIRLWLISDPDLIREVLTTRNDSFGRTSGNRRLRLALGDGLLTSDGDGHDERSRAAWPAFRTTEVGRYAPAAVAATETVVDSWRDGATLDLPVELSRIALGIVGRNVLGLDFLGAAEEVGAALTDLLKLLEERRAKLLSLPLIFPTSWNRRFLRARGTLDATAFEVIRASRAALARGRPEDGEPCLVGRLVAQTGGGGGPAFTDRQLRDEVVTLLFAAYEQTVYSLAFTLRLIGEHREVKERLCDEAARVLGGRPRLEAADVERLPLAAQVFAETLRLYPTSAILYRRAAEDVTLGGGRVTVRKGALAAVSPWVVHRDPRWFPDPLAFRPERFAPDAPRPAPFTYFPFGAGKRTCIGRAFARMYAVVVVPTILRRVDLSFDTSQELRVVNKFALHPADGLPAIVRGRRAA